MRPTIPSGAFCSRGDAVLTLALDASTYVGSVALLDGARVLAWHTVAMRGAHEERLLPAVAATLEEAKRRPRDVSRLVCGAGPGSFTSLRIAASIAKGLATVTGAPLHGISSLLLLGAGAESPLPEGRWVALLDAMRGDRFALPLEVDAAGHPRATGPATLVRDADVPALLAEHRARAVGPGQERDASPDARGIVRLAADLEAAEPVALDGWEPDYGRLAEAQVRWEAAHGRALPTG